MSCSVPRCGSSWMSASPIASSPRRGEIRWRCSSCPRDLTRRGAGGRLRAAERARRSPNGSSRASSGSLHPLTADARRLLLLAAADPLGDPSLLWRAAASFGIAPASGDLSRPRAAGDRQRVVFRHPLARSAVYRSAAVAGTARRPSGLGARDRRRRRPGPPGMASGECGGRTGRAGRAGARTLGRAGPDARRPSRRGRVPAACGRVDRRPARDGPSERWRPPRRASGRVCSRRRMRCWRPRRPAPRRARACPGRADAGRVGVRAGPRPRRAVLLARAAGSSSRWTFGSRATPISRRGARRCSRAIWPAPPAACATSPARYRALRRIPRRPRDLLLDGLALIFTEGRSAATPVLRQAVAAFASADASDGGDAPLGVAGDACGELSLGLRQLPRDRHARGSARPRLRGARGRSPSPTTSAVRRPRSAVISPAPRG